ncbi:MAG: DmsE family decaheme c-type cytochrome [Planctomycetes bacterium]|nr:DmsE family decaheme c-type cytochrome [Planctomycetota bacterium]
MKGLWDRRRLLALLALSGAALGGLASCTSKKHTEAADTTAWVKIEGATYVDNDACMTCHADQAEHFKTTRHAKMNDPRTPAAKHECQSCHGPGSVHVKNHEDDKEGLNDIIRFTEGKGFPGAQLAAQCLECHQGEKRAWQTTSHAATGMACASCHSIHSPQGDKQLKQATELETCAQCHKDVRNQMQRPSHHPVREGKIGCKDCHDPHGTGYEKNLRGANPNDTCFKCHQEKAGPYLWQHAPVFENCLTCHTPHGSNNRVLLAAKPPQLCQRCHSDSQHPGTVYDKTTLFEGSTPNAHAVHNACIDCHSQIHGSNHPGGKFFMR